MPPRSLALLAALGLTGACAHHGAATPPNERTASATDPHAAQLIASARPEIEAANKAWLPGLAKRDAQAIAEAYADSGIFVAPDGQTVRGRAAVARMYEARFAALGRITGGNVVQDGMTVAGERIYEWGHAWLEMEPAGGGASMKRGGLYLTVWERQSDGHWRIVRNLSL